MNKIILNHKDQRKYVYHYTKASTAFKILEKRELKIGSFTSTNDPKETKQWQFNLGTNQNRDLGKYNTIELSNKLSNELKEKTKIICFSRDKAPLTGDHTRDIFNRGFCKPRMWAQYADNHKGICMIFDMKMLNDIILERFSQRYTVLQGDVAYFDRDITPRLSEEGAYIINIDYFEQLGLSQYAKAHFKIYFMRLFFEKMTDWSNENEYRWIFITDLIGDLYFDYGLSLIGIVFGENTEKTDIDRIIEMTKYEIKYTGIKWKNCSPWYDFGNFKYDKALRNSPWYKER